MDRGRLGMRWWAASHLPPSGGGSYRKIFIVLEPAGARNTDIFIYIIICMYIYVSIKLGSGQVGSRSARFKSSRVKSDRFKSGQVGPGRKQGDDNGDDADGDDDDGDDDGDYDVALPPSFFFAIAGTTPFVRWARHRGFLPLQL